MKKFTLFTVAFLVTFSIYSQSLADKCPKPTNAQQINTNKLKWDVLWTFPTNAGAQPGIETNGTFFYTPTWNAAAITRYDMDGGNPTDFTISGVSNIRDLAFDGTYFYGAAADMSLKVMDLDNETLISTISATCTGVTGIRHISYDPELDGGNGGFWIGNWAELGAISMDGSELVASVTGNANCYGSAYDNSDPSNPCLWLFQQPNSLAVFFQFDINTLTYTGISHDAADVPGNEDGMAGGACIYEDTESGLTLLVGNLQMTPNLVFAYELAGGTSAFDYDVELYEINLPSYVAMGNQYDLTGMIQNRGNETITSIDISYAINGGDTQVYSASDLSILAGSYYNFTHDAPIVLPEGGTYEVEVTLTNLNGEADENPDDNTLTHSIKVASQSVAHLPLYEEFTSSTCAPCAGYNSSILDPLLNDPNNDGKFALIKYQMSWPGAGDPYFTEEGGVRRYYYGISGVPDLMTDGMEGKSVYDNQSSMDALNEKEAFIEVSAWHDMDGTNMHVLAQIKPYFDITDFKVHIAVVEKMTTENVTTNGETEFYNVMMKMMPDASGTSVTAYDGDVIYIEETADLSGTFIEEFEDLEVVVFIQDDETKMVFNSTNSIEGYTGIQDIDNTSVKIYPNPAKEVANISFTLDKLENVTFKVYDMLGKIVYQESNSEYAIGQHNIAMNTSILKEGMYFIELSIGNKVVTQKLSITK